MKIKTTSERKDWGEYESLEIIIDDHFKFFVHNSNSVEDHTLSRNFQDCFDIPEMMRLAYEAGKNGEEFEVEHIHEGDDLD